MFVLKYIGGITESYIKIYEVLCQKCYVKQEIIIKNFNAVHRSWNSVYNLMSMVGLSAQGKSKVIYKKIASVCFECYWWSKKKN